MPFRQTFRCPDRPEQYIVHSFETVSAFAGVRTFFRQSARAGTDRTGKAPIEPRVMALVEAPVLKVMLVEDNLLLADALEATLEGMGYEVCGMASSVDEAVKMAELHLPDLAIVDMRLSGEARGTELAARMGVGRIGILYATGNTAEVALSSSDGLASIRKPFSHADLRTALGIVADIHMTGQTFREHPRGFRLLDGAPRLVSDVA